MKRGRFSNNQIVRILWDTAEDSLAVVAERPAAWNGVLSCRRKADALQANPTTA